MSRQVHIVPHTHWDREWYKPYPVFRMQLVELLDGLLPQLEDDESFAHFQLDGQLAVVDDYLEIRPHERDRLARLNSTGQLSMGPWYTLPDEFLVSGETHIRNLRLGRATAANFGGAMEVGYLPDMFGHIAQMPQILAGFGLDHAVVWRGVPSSIASPAFWWEAPDGSVVRAEYLSDGYGNGARVPEHGKDLIDQVQAFCDANEGWVGNDILWMNGTDHLLPQPHLGQVVADANQSGSEFEFSVTSLSEHLVNAPTEGLPTWQDEMRSGARSNLLMGVASCRVDVKQAAAVAERTLERVAEPLATCWPAGEGYPHAFLDLAWKDMVRNAAHDSICGCSADEVNDAVLHRYAEATRVGEAIVERALVRVLAQSRQNAVVVNPSNRTRAAIVTAVVPGDVAPPHTQQVSVRPARQRTDTLDRTTARAVILRAVGDDPRVSRATLEELDDGTLVATLHADRSPKSVDTAALHRQLDELCAANPSGTVHLELARPRPSQELLLRTDLVPGYGWRGLAPSDLGASAVRATATDGSEVALTNGTITVAVDPSDGTFSVEGVSGMGRIVSDGDAGDTYNWSPPTHDRAVDQPQDVTVGITESGPVRGRLEITRTYLWPARIENGRRVGETPTTVVTTLEVRAGEDLVRVRVSFDNRCHDHRVRMWFPLPSPAATSQAECAFTTVSRGLVAEGGPNEFGLPTFPSRRFVSAGGLLVGHQGLCEYELTEVRGGGEHARAHAVAVTLLRSVGLISAGPMTMRSLPAGPPTPTPGAQMQGHQQMDLVIHLGNRDPYEVVDDAFSPLLTARFPGRDGLGDATVQGQSLEVSGAEVSALTTRSDGRIELRVFNPTDAPTNLRVAGRCGQVCDLDGNATGTAFEDTMTLAPQQIVTLALDQG